MPGNPFKTSILSLVKAHPSGISEYNLIQLLLVCEEEFSFVEENPKLALFRQHFLVMNALYQLQTELFADGMLLSISPLDIRLGPVSEPSAASLPDEYSVMPLREYYLDWGNFFQTSEADVDTMLIRFMERYLAIDERLDALRLLELPVNASWAMIKQAYRRLAAQHHPDKGGEPDRFRAIRRAYEVLTRCHVN